MFVLFNVGHAKVWIIYGIILEIRIKLNKVNVIFLYKAVYSVFDNVKKFERLLKRIDYIST